MNSLRTTFDEDASLYDRARPGYPSAVYDDLWRLAGLGPGSRLVEIGPGTGQATAELLRRGARVVAIELGANLAARLRQSRSGATLDGALEVVEGTFEDWPGAGPVDAVAAFTSWHWLDPAVRATKTAALLRDGGALATVTTDHVRGGTEEFFAQVQECYERWDPATPPGLRLLDAHAIPPATDEIDGHDCFAPAVRYRYHTEITYSAQQYLDVLGTYSGHRALPEASRRGLLDSIGALIEGGYGGRITKAYLRELRVARRRPR